MFSRLAKMGTVVNIFETRDSNFHVGILYALSKQFLSFCKKPRVNILFIACDSDSWHSPVIHLLEARFRGSYYRFYGFQIITLMIGKGPH